MAGGVGAVLMRKGAKSRRSTLGPLVPQGLGRSRTSGPGPESDVSGSRLGTHERSSKRASDDVSDLDGIVGQHVSLPSRIELPTAGHAIATGDIFVDDADAVLRIRALDAVLVDMESYAYAYVAGEFGVPLRIIKAVSDRAQGGATQLWDEVVATCSAALWESFRADYGLSR